MKRKQIYLLSILILLSTLFVNYAFAEDQSDKEHAQKTLDQINDYKKRGVQDSLFTLAKELLVFSEKLQFLDFEGEACKRIAAYYLGDAYDIDSSNYYYHKASEAYSSIGDNNNQGVMLVSLAINLMALASRDEALAIYMQGLELLETTDNSLWSGIANNHIGQIYFYEGNYYLALKYLLKSIHLFKKLEDYRNVGVTYNSIGIIYRNTKDKDKEENAYLQAINYLEKIEETYTLGLVYNNLSELYFDKGEVASAFEMLEKAKNIYENDNYPLGMCAYYSVLAYYYTTKESPNYHKVIEYCNKSLPIAEEYGDYRQYADATSFLGNAYLELGRINEALTVLHEGLKVAQENDFKSEIVAITQALSKAYKLGNDPKNALKYLEINTHLNDSILNEEKIKEFTQLDMSFKFRQQQLSDSLKNEQIQVALQYEYENRISLQKQYNIFVVIVAALLLLFGAYMLVARRKLTTRNNALKQKNQLINQQKSEIEIYSNSINKAYQQLKELDAYKRATTSMLVHDLKNPLNLLVNIDAFGEEAEKDKIVRHTSRQMLNLIMNLLDINKAEENSTVLNLKEIALSETIYAALQETAYLAEQKNISINNTSAHEFKLMADKEMLQRVFVNLLTNAIKYSPNNDRIQIDCRVNDKQKLVVAVKDNGPGIDIKHHQEIFEKFRQINKIKSGNVGSTGLGLAYCKLAVDAHQWTIGLNSSPGHGAEFWIGIPDYKESGALKPEDKQVKDPALVVLNIKLTTDEAEKLDALFVLLKKQPIFAKSDIKDILDKMRQLKIQSLNEWISKAQYAVNNLDEHTYHHLLDQLQP